MNLKNIPSLAYNLPQDVLCLKYNGDFEQEIELIDALLKRSLPQPLVERLQMEKLLAEGMMKDYETSFDEALAKFQANIEGFTAEELKSYMVQGVIDWRYRRGEIAFQDAFYSSLLINTPALKQRLKDPDEKARQLAKSTLLDDNMRIMKEKGRRGYRYHIRHTLSPRDNYFRPNQFQHLHIPLPIETEWQKNFKLLSASDYKCINTKGPQGTIYFEAAPETNTPCFVEYTYECWAYYKKLDNAAVEPLKLEPKTRQPIDHDGNPLGSYLLEEMPHIWFTPYLRALAESLAGKETNPLAKARKYYDFITKNVRYTYMRDYFLYENIPEFAALNLRGDCGVQGLLFITLCRLSGIPARWTSGFCLTPTTVGSHDWTQFYVEPYGWLFCDPSYGGGAFRSGNEERRDYYFGNLDCFRMTANHEFQAEFVPAKKFMRIDPYDSQSGEIEYDDAPLLSGEIQSKRTMVESEEL